MISHLKVFDAKLQNDELELELAFDNQSELEAFSALKKVETITTINTVNKYFLATIKIPAATLQEFIETLISTKFANLDTRFIETSRGSIVIAVHSTIGEYLNKLNKAKEIPTPPPPPETAMKGYTADGYMDLINSLPEGEREMVLSELETSRVKERADRLVRQIASQEMLFRDMSSTREMFLAALLCVRDNRLTKNQLATMHIHDSAIRTLYTNPAVYLLHSYEKNNEVTNTSSVFIQPLSGMPTAFRTYPFNLTLVPDDKIGVNDLPYRMRSPLVKRFFNFTDQEWTYFCKQMENAPESEKRIAVLQAPEAGCWSSIIYQIQKLLDCMQVLDWMVPLKDGYYIEKIMPVPSFTMFQAALNTKAHTLNREPLTLVPTYYYVSPTQYERYKASGLVAMSLYLPEFSPSLQYNSQVGRFRSTIDGHPAETAFGGALHDEYHAFREMQMKENITAARTRLAWIAKNHPLDKMNAKLQPISEQLMDGELIYSYPGQKIRLFNPEFRVAGAQIFGEIFHTESMKAKLHPDLKRAFIRDMVENKDDWRNCLGLGRGDLLAEDQAIYDQIDREIAQQESKRMKM